MRIGIVRICLMECSKKIIFVLFFVFPLFIYSQVPQRGQLKLSSLLQKRIGSLSAKSQQSFLVSGKNTDSLRSLLQDIKELKIVYEYKPAGLFVIQTTVEKLQSVLGDDRISFVDSKRDAKEELAVSNLDLSTNKVNLTHQLFRLYNGDATTVSIKENRPDTEDIDFKGRYLSTTLSSSVFSTHASDMATIIAGGGNTYYEGKGVAWGATISSSSFDILLPEADAAYQQYGISVQNHSYGTGIENYYGADAAAYDASVITRPALFHIFSAGNSGLETDTIGTYKDVANFANITGSFKMAKNIITVGHADSLYNVLPPSSRGPAYDGRVKPELVAFAQDGSSGAAAIVSGIALSLQQAYKILKGQLPPAALIKAILINSADDVGEKGIDFISGYGNANSFRSMQALAAGHYLTGSVSNADSVKHNLIVPAGTSQLKVTLCWSDPPAAANAAKALVNDLDLSLSLVSTGQRWLPWVLNSYPDVDSLNQLPVRKRDSLNNVEQISIDNPLPGNYELTIKGFAVSNSGPQDYYIAYQSDSVNKFQWYYPTASDNIFGKRDNILRWECSYSDNTGELEYSLDKGTSWKLIDNSAALQKRYIKWNVPDTFATALLRMHIGSTYFTSDTFTISDRFDVHVGFNCNDSFAFSWNKIPGVDSFKVYKLGQKYMEPLINVADTFLVLNKIANPSLYYAITPLVDNKEGVRSYAINYTAQGTGCYIQSFLAQLSGNNGLLYLQLGTLYNIQSITWQKLVTSGYKDLQSIPAITITDSYTDIALSKGVNTYRVKIELINGQSIYSDPASIYYFGSDNYIIFPNPVAQGQSLTILRNEFDTEQLQVFNTAGAKLLERELDNQVNNVPVGQFGKGLYLIQILKNGKRQQVFKVLVY